MSQQPCVKLIGRRYSRLAQLSASGVQVRWYGEPGMVQIAEVLSAIGAGFSKDLIQSCSALSEFVSRSVYDRRVSLTLDVPLAEAPIRVMILQYQHRPTGGGHRSIGKRRSNVKGSDRLER